MSSVLVLNHYLVWHYSLALSSILHLWKNFLWFTVHFFSIKDLVRTFFAPWKRMTESAEGKGWDLEAIGTAIVINIFSRLVGALIRSILIVIGLVTLTLLFCSIVVVYLFWLLAPFMVVLLLGWGIILLI